VQFLQEYKSAQSKLTENSVTQQQLMANEYSFVFKYIKYDSSFIHT